ncbi:MAG: type III-B CRISPR-associated protein Cas10/Cmr2, partial [Cyanobacteria bacterium J06642_2]
MSQFWQAKLWGLLHDPLLKGLYRDKAAQGYWQDLLETFQPSDSCQQADSIAVASDRPAWDVTGARGFVNYKEREGLQVSHLLSGRKLELTFTDITSASAEQDRTLGEREREALSQFKTDHPEATPPETFWWAWRCLPVELANAYGEQLALLPADTRIPDCSVWSHNSLSAAIAGSLQGYNSEPGSRPYLGIFSFSPVQELIKASRKMQDFWAGSWLLHYLSAKVCWTWAQQYGPDSLVYPSLYAQPLIDTWLLEKWPHFQKWVSRPSPSQLLTAGFPNVLTVVLPSSRIEPAMQTAHQVLHGNWLDIGDRVWAELGKKQGVNEARLWKGWLKKQWQTYWTGLPLGDRDAELKKGQGKIVAPTASNPGANVPDLKQDFYDWVEVQNKACHLRSLPKDAIAENLSWRSEAFPDEHLNQQRPTLAELTTYETHTVGLWWSPTFDRLRQNLAAVKLPRTWELPTVFAPRSTISGIGPVLHPNSTDTPQDWSSEADTKTFWTKTRGWFDGNEQLNATEV